MNRPGSSFHLRPLKNSKISTLDLMSTKGYGFMDAKYNAKLPGG
jgi:hypothetical protein